MASKRKSNEVKDMEPSTSRSAGTGKGGNSKSQQQVKPARNRFMVFRDEFGAKCAQNPNGNLHEESKAAAKAWKKLSEAEKAKYHDAFLERRPERQDKEVSKEEEQKKENKRVPLFHTRCSPTQFSKLVKFVNTKARLQERVKAIGFGNLLKVDFERLPHDLIASMLKVYDPPTHKFSIRGITRDIDADDIQKLLGIPHTGEAVRTDVSDNDSTFQELKKVYRRKRYSKILEEIESKAETDAFEFLFVLYTLGTFLCPMSSGGVTDRTLKVMCCTKDRLGGYDWASFVMNELWKEMSDYVSAYRRKREGKREGDGMCNVGGCLYLLLLFLGEYFPVKKFADHKSICPVEFWTKDRIDDLINTERKSNIGLLFSRSTFEARARVEDSEVVHYLTPDLKKFRVDMVNVIDNELTNARTRILRQLDDQLMHVQMHRPGQDASHDQHEGHRHEDDVGVGVDSVGPEGVGGDEQEDKVGHEDGDDDGVGDEEAGDDEGDDEGAGVGDDDDEGSYELNNEVEEHSPSVTCSLVNVSEDSEDEVEEDINAEEEVESVKGEKLRRSTRVCKPAITSPYVELKAPPRKTKETDARDALYKTITASMPTKQKDRILVSIMDEDIDREQLWGLGGEYRCVGNRVVSVVCKLLMHETRVKQPRGAPVKRHIFTADFMHKLAHAPIGWDVSAAKNEVLPEKIGYNLGDCDLILGPTLSGVHWFCVALVPKTMQFYVLDSLMPNLKPTSKDAKAVLRDRTKVLQTMRDRLYDIIGMVKPDRVSGKAKSKIEWTEVPQQNNLKDCGVHVLIWLTEWSPGATLNYTNEHIPQFRKDLMWWLVNHPLNTCHDEALSVLKEKIVEKKDDSAIEALIAQQKTLETKRRRLS